MKVSEGIAGLSTYLHLCKHLPDPSKGITTVYELYKSYSAISSTSLRDCPIQSVNLDALSESTAIVGGGLNILPNGIRVLHDLSRGLHDRVVAQAFLARNFNSKGANS